MNWRSLSKLLRAIDFYNGKPQGHARRWAERTVAASLKQARADVLRMGYDPDRIVAGLSAYPVEDEGESTDSPLPQDETGPVGYGRADPVVSDPD